MLLLGMFGSAMRELTEAFLEARAWPHPAPQIELIETHISYVLLAGDFAYKMKKPIRLPFVDFSALEVRRRCCEDELRLNRRLTDVLYLESARYRVGAPMNSGSGGAHGCVSRRPRPG